MPTSHTAFRTTRPWPLAIAVAAGLSTLPVGTFAGERLGMTWAKAAHNHVLGIDAISCHGGGTSCMPTTGDTSCSTALPVLCIKLDGSARPNYRVQRTAGSMPDEFYRGWAGGHIATTAPVAGTALTSAAVADGFCATSFGSGWRMAEFHDGRFMPGMDRDSHYGTAQHWHSTSPWSNAGSESGGWAFWAYGNVRDDTRLWVHINDQPANCWN
ncbi:MAG: flagellar hook-length control protein [Pseudomonadota bacterium]